MTDKTEKKKAKDAKVDVKVEETIPQEDLIEEEK